MEFQEVIISRRSIREFEEKKVEKELISRILEMAFYSPSSHNRRPWYVIVVTSRELLEKLSYAKPHATPLKNASLALVICADENISDVWIEDSSIFAEHVQLAATNLALGSVWIQIRKRMHDENMTAEDYVRSLLGIPSNIKVLCIIGIGYPAEKKEKHRKEEIKELKSRVKENHFSNLFPLEL